MSKIITIRKNGFGILPNLDLWHYFWKNASEKKNKKMKKNNKFI